MVSVRTLAPPPKQIYTLPRLYAGALLSSPDFDLEVVTLPTLPSDTYQLEFSRP